MAEHLEGLMSTSMEKIRELVDVNTIIGDPVNSPDGTIIIPVSKVCFGRLRYSLHSTIGGFGGRLGRRHHHLATGVYRYQNRRRRENA